MTAILRLSAGEEAPWDGTYALVREWGEPTGFAVLRSKGQRLPLVAVAAEGPLWYTLVGNADDLAQTA